MNIEEKIKAGIKKRKGEKKKEEKKPEIQDDYMKQAKEIYSYVLSHEVGLEELTEKYATFYTVFPEVMNYMVSIRAFSPRAFDKVIKKKNKIPRTVESFWVLQATYARELYKVLYPHYDTTKVNKLYKDTYENYENVYKELEKMEKELDQEKQTRTEEYDKERRKELFEYITNMKSH